VPRKPQLRKEACHLCPPEGTEALEDLPFFIDEAGAKRVDP
jgi:hypothetical protein